MLKRNAKDAGFSLIELMIVVLIIAIIVTIAIATYVASVTNSRRIACLSNQRILTEAASVYASDVGGPPTDIEDLRPYANTFDTIIHCPSDFATLLEWNTVTEEIDCAIHP